MYRVELNKGRVLIILTVVALAFGAYFLRGYIPLIFFSMIMAYLFGPWFKWFERKTGRSGTAASLTFLASLFVVLIPLAIVIVITVIQLQHLLGTLSEGQAVDINDVQLRATTWINNILAHFPGGYHITDAQIKEWINQGVTAIANGILDFLKGSISSIASMTTTVILYIYIFVNLLMHQGELIALIKRLDPLGPNASSTYMDRMGAMTIAMVRGQFIIAICQGFTEAVLFQIAGIHGLFMFLFLIFTILSIIPLGAGIIAIPAGILLILTGHIWEGAVILIGHFAIVTNIDNVLRPKLVPKRIRLNSALTILGVFAGIAMFGFLGIVIGPVIMILITTTLQMYLSSTKFDPSDKTANVETDIASAKLEPVKPRKRRGPKPKK